MKYNNLILILVFLTMISMSYSIPVDYYGDRVLRTGDKYSNTTYAVVFGNGSDISPCNVVLDGETKSGSFSNGYCRYTIDFTGVTQKTDYTFYGQYMGGQNLNTVTITYYPTAAAVAEVPFMDLFSLISTIFVILGGVIYASRR